jgi:hypothetical protein
MSLIADLVVSSAAAAFAHFGVTLEVPEREPPRAERIVARSQVRKPDPAVARTAEDCPDKQAAIHRI